MKRYYRNRLILGAMLSFFILLVLAVAGIWLFSYRQTERETDSFLEDMMRAEGEAFSRETPPPMFGYTPDQRRYPAGFYDITLNADGTIRNIQRVGIPEEAETDIEQYVRQAAGQGQNAGKTGSFKYRMIRQEDGTARLIMLDISIQLQALYNMLKSALLVGAALMVLLFLILLPVSTRMAGIFVRNNEKQKQFITDAGHDLKTPVAIIRANLDVLELRGKSKWSENIRSQTERLEGLIAQLMMMARLEEDGENRQAVSLDFTALLREQWKAYVPVFAQKHITAQADIEEGLQLRGGEDSLKKMTALLLDNVSQYTNDGGSASLTARRERNRIRLRLENTVDRLPEQDPSALTGRFIRGDTARNQKSGGSGIGLAAVSRIVEIHRGKLEIRYEGEHLFCVTVELPCQRKEPNRKEKHEKFT